MSKLKIHRLRGASLVSLLLLGSGCSPVYLLSLGYGQARLLQARIPVQQALNDGTLSPDEREKVRLVLEVKAYTEEKLGLKPTQNYIHFVRLKEGAVCYVLSASPVDRLEPYQWWFPIVGKVPYKGFFSKQAAQKAKEKLERQGYDTYLREAIAFSTLGWFRDPITSSMLAHGAVSLADTIIHELAHSTFFVKNRMDFNESLATFIGQRGAIDFFCSREGKSSSACLAAQSEARDEMDFSRLMEELYERLEALYSRPIPREEKLRLRGEIFGEVRETRRWEMNNATLLAFRTYHHQIELYQQVYDRLKGDLRGSIALFKQATSRGPDPLGWLTNWLKENPAALP